MLPTVILLIKLIGWIWGVSAFTWGKRTFATLRPEDLTDCSIGPPQLLLAYRLAMLGWALFIGLRQVVRTGRRVFIFFTVWNWWLLTAFFALGSAACLRAARQRPARAKNATWGRGVDLLGRATLATFCIATPMALLVDGMTWLVLVPMLEGGAAGPSEAAYWHSVHHNFESYNMSLALFLLTWFWLVPMVLQNPDAAHTRYWRERFYSFESYNQHGFNAVMILGDLLLNRIPVDLYSSGWVALWSSLFGVWSALFYLRTGRFIYPFLDARKPYAWASYLGLFAVHVGAFLAVVAMTRAKQRFLLSGKAASKTERIGRAPRGALPSDTPVRLAGDMPLGGQAAAALPVPLEAGPSRLKSH